MTISQYKKYKRIFKNGMLAMHYFVPLGPPRHDQRKQIRRSKCGDLILIRLARVYRNRPFGLLKGRP